MSNLVEQDEQSVAGALFQTSFQIGGALGISLSSLIVTERAKVTGSLLSALRGGFWFNAALAWIGEDRAQHNALGNADLSQYRS